MSGRQRRTGSDRLRERARALIERGLGRFSDGDVEGAVVDWRHALTLDPHAEDAKYYIARAEAENSPAPEGLEAALEEPAPEDSDDPAPASEPAPPASASPDAPASASPDPPASASPDARHTASPDARHTASPDARHTASPDARHTASDSESWFDFDESDTDPQSVLEHDSSFPLDAIEPKLGSKPAHRLEDLLGDILEPGSEVPNSRDTLAEGWPLSEPPLPARPPSSGPRPEAGDRARPGSSRPPYPTSKQTLKGPPMPAEVRRSETGGTQQRKTVPRPATSPPAATEPPDLGAAQTVQVAFDDAADADPGAAAAPEPEAIPATRVPRPHRDNSPASLAPTVELTRAGTDPDALARESLDLASTLSMDKREMDAGRDEGAADAGRDEGQPASPSPVIIEEVDSSDDDGSGAIGYLDLSVRAAQDVTPDTTVEVMRELRPLPADEPPPETRSTAPMPPPEAPTTQPEPGSAVPVEDARGDTAPTPGFDAPVAHSLLADLDAAVPRRLGDDEALRGRMRWLLERAQSECAAGNNLASVIALDLLFDEDPDSVASQKMIQRHREALIEIYQRYEDDPGAIPVAAISPAEYGSHQLDSRAAFLLSRIDGMLTIDELLSVAGMPALEAHRHLCSLLRRGLLTLR